MSSVDENPTMAHMMCGCRAVEGDWVQRPTIIFCPLHEAAEEMYQALQYVEGQLHRGMFPTTLAKVEQALVAARTQQPADDSEMPLGPIQAPARGA